MPTHALFWQSRSQSWDRVMSSSSAQTWWLVFSSSYGNKGPVATCETYVFRILAPIWYQSVSAMTSQWRVLTIHSLKFEARILNNVAEEVKSRVCVGEAVVMVQDEALASSGRSARIPAPRWNRPQRSVWHFKELHCARPRTGTQVCTPSPSRPRNSPPPAYTQPHTCCSRAPHTHIEIWTCSIKWTESIEQKTSCSLQTY